MNLREIIPMVDADRHAFPERKERGAYFLVGPTASGKTAVSHFLAMQQGAVILSADSMLVYKGMDIGTAKPTEKERAEISYFGLDLVAPGDNFSVGAYLEHAAEAFETAGRCGSNVFVTGGTGLYIKCLTEGLDETGAADPDSRSRAESILENDGVSGLQQALKAAAPDRLAALKDPDNPRRLIRALELAWKGQPLNRKWSAKPVVPFVGLAVEPETLLQRIRDRVQTMYEEGLLEEAESLRKGERPLSETARHAIGYEEAFDLLDGKKTRSEAMEMTIRRTRRLAKRQMTWFRGQANVKWIDVGAGDSTESIAAKVAACWKQYGRTLVNF